MAKAQILIVEDDGIVAMDIESQLKQLGYSVPAIASNGEEAIKKAEEQNPDLVLMDIVLKGEMDGIEAAEIIRTRFGTPVIFLTAYADEKRLERAKLTTPFGYILKPFQDRDLKVTVDMALYTAKVNAEHKQTEEALRESEELHRITLNNISDAVFITDNTGAFTYICPNVAVIFGYSYEEVEAFGNISKLIGNPFYDSNDLETLGEIKNIEKETIDKNGQNHTLLINVKSVSIKGGTVLYTCRDITERKQADQALQERDKELEIKAHNLEEANTALKVLLKIREKDNKELEDKILLNVKEMVLPFLNRLKNSGLNAKQRIFSNIIESNLNDIISPFSKDLASKFWDLTPTEIQVANLVKAGKTTKEIAELLNSSPRAIEFHRGNLRKKLGLKNKKANLRSILLSFS